MSEDMFCLRGPPKNLKKDESGITQRRTQVKSRTDRSNKTSIGDCEAPQVENKELSSKKRKVNEMSGFFNVEDVSFEANYFNKKFKLNNGDEKNADRVKTTSKMLDCLVTSENLNVTFSQLLDNSVPLQPAESQLESNLQIQFECKLNLNEIVNSDVTVLSQPK